MHCTIVVLATVVEMHHYMQHVTYYKNTDTLNNMTDSHIYGSAICSEQHKQA